MNILLINPNAMSYTEQSALLNKTSILRVPTFSMPVGLMDIVAYTRQHVKVDRIEILDFGVVIYDFYLNWVQRNSITVEQCVDESLAKIQFIPDVVGISLLFASAHHCCMLLAEKVKRKWKDCLLIFGGNQATNIYRELLSNPNIDYCFRGEAELPFAEFVQNLSGGKRCHIKGVFGKADIERGTDEKCEMIKDLTLLPMPAFDVVDTAFYQRTAGASVMWSRGCPFHCTFCATSTVHGRELRHKSVAQCLAEIRHLIERYKFKNIFIEDDLFAGKKKTFLKLARAISKIRGDCKFELPQGLSVSILDEDRVDAMLKMGILQGAVAVESGSEYVQKHIMKKNVNLAKASKILAYMRKVGFNAHTNFILGSPHETDAMRQESLDYMKALDVNWVYMFHALPLPGSEMFKAFEQVADMRSMDWDTVRLGLRTFDTTDIKAADLERMVYDTNIELNFFNNCNIRHGRYELAIQIWTDFILSPFPFHVVGRYSRAMAYRKLGKEAEATKDLADCVQWIHENAESRRLYERYGLQMQELADLMKSNGSVSEIVQQKPSLSGGRVIPVENV
jgi:radical SAM superfamily enzyme YgiQ (UPF0313 family)